MLGNERAPKKCFLSNKGTQKDIGNGGGAK